METSSLVRRTLAFIVDCVFTALCFVPVWIQLAGSWLNTGTLSVSFQWIAVGLLLQLFYKWLFLYFVGATIGKWIFGLRVVPIHHPDQGLGLFQSFLRVLTDGLSIFFGLSLRALAFIRLDRTHVSDWVAETRVVQTIPLRHRPERHWVLAVLIIIVSFSSQFQRIYHLVQSVEITDGQVSFDASH